MQVREVMTTEVVTATVDTPLPELIDLMVTRNVTGLPVVDADGHVAGVVTEADLLARQAFADAERPVLAALADFLRGGPTKGWINKAAGLTTGEIMSSPAHVATPGEPLRSAANRMLSLGVKRLPVVDRDGRLVGIVSRRDLLRLFHRSDDEIAAEIRRTLADPLRCPEEHGVTLTCVSSGVAYLGGWTSGADDETIIDHAVRNVPGVIDVRSGISPRVAATRAGAHR